MTEEQSLPDGFEWSEITVGDELAEFVAAQYCSQPLENPLSYFEWMLNQSFDSKSKSILLGVRVSKS